jgi:hypothetical protein
MRLEILNLMGFEWDVPKVRVSSPKPPNKKKRTAGQSEPMGKEKDMSADASSTTSASTMPKSSTSKMQLRNQNRNLSHHVTVGASGHEGGHEQTDQTRPPTPDTSPRKKAKILGNVHENADSRGKQMSSVKTKPRSGAEIRKHGRDASQIPMKLSAADALIAAELEFVASNRSSGEKAVVREDEFCYFLFFSGGSDHDCGCGGILAHVQVHACTRVGRSVMPLSWLMIIVTHIVIVID